MPFVLDIRLNYEQRPGEQGYLVGSVHFVDGSELFFREYLDATPEGVEKLMYSYHYQDGEKRLLFRYDNAMHRPRLPSRSHKHTKSGVEAAPAPTLAQVMEEFVQMCGWI
ncbi:MAG: hypothetical protein GXP42_10655 [Chloroflexi bacterium]|nr:hypothetical protein [Chloroflexota bacterium]